MCCIWAVVLCMHNIYCCGAVPPGLMVVLSITLIILGFLHCWTTGRPWGGWILAYAFWQVCILAKPLYMWMSSLMLLRYAGWEDVCLLYVILWLDSGIVARLDCSGYLRYNCNCPCLRWVLVVDWLVGFLALVRHEPTLFCSIDASTYNC